MSADELQTLGDQLAELRSMLISIQDLLSSPRPTRSAYTVEEVASILEKAPYTVRQWCLEGRINATKRAERRGGAEVWSIPAEEVVRYQDEGLLPRISRRRTG